MNSFGNWKFLKKQSFLYPRLRQKKSLTGVCMLSSINCRVNCRLIGDLEQSPTRMCKEYQALQLFTMQECLCMSRAQHWDYPQAFQISHLCRKLKFSPTGLNIYTIYNILSLRHRLQFSREISYDARQPQTVTDHMALKAGHTVKLN